ncbi:bifunctional DNA-formamidopyrimidine glycosylase/DNA-(apurinic or apyrimidinic site) lyase [Elongatibacter sediminis]|uniref:Formamidopyrimidine-DNA glycosylase n=1 Tax=Elongatibacter sediminis TaxID=3119006 RepID=A0AAW9R806_9GAMM
MPELPEVETTLRGIRPALDGRIITEVRVRNPALRWPVPDTVQQACGRTVRELRRRAKYLLIDMGGGGLMCHLGMSGSMRIVREGDPPRPHDHFDLVTDAGNCIRFHDPRRFGALLWWDTPAGDHPLLRDLGPEPLGDDFSGDHLWQRSRGLRGAVKNFVMNGHVVVGVGNIYASEALFMAGIHPTRPAGRISRARYQGLAAAIRDVLQRAVEHGGTTLRDFLDSSGTPGYFAQELLVYDREGHACFQCGTAIRRRVIGQRSSFYCIRCQR